MGKKKATFKNIMVTLGCTAFAGVYVLGGGYVISTFMDGANGARPAWLERVEIHVDENASGNIVADNSVSGSVIAEAAGAEGARSVDSSFAGQSSANGVKQNGNNDKSNSEDTLQKPRFDEDEEETETEELETETDLESETENEQAEEEEDEK